MSVDCCSPLYYSHLKCHINEILFTSLFLYNFFRIFLLIVIVTIVENECNQYVISKALKIIQNVQTKKIEVKNNINVFIKSCIIKNKKLKEESKGKHEVGNRKIKLKGSNKIG